MKLQKATKIAIACMQDEMKHLAFAANLYEKFGADLPHVVAASARRKELRDAIDALRSEQHAGIPQGVAPGIVKSQDVTP